MDLLPEEEEAVLYSVIPDVYDGYRWSDGYELTRYVNDVNRSNTQVLMEYGASSNLKTKYTYGNERLSASNAAASGLTGNTSPASYITDGRGSVSALYGAAIGAASSSLSVLANYTYGPFGETSAAGAPASSGVMSAQESFYGFNAEEYNPLTSLQYLRARYYDPNTGRFGAADTYTGSLLSPLTQNLYTYVQNDPVNYADPSGRQKGTVPASCW